jgi:hypothetical protein
MHNPGAADTRSRVVRQDLLAAELETGFALLRAAAQSRTEANRAFELQQIEEARRALAHARELHANMHEKDAKQFSARLEELNREFAALGRRAGRGTLTAGG